MFSWMNTCPDGVQAAWLLVDRVVSHVSSVWVMSPICESCLLYMSHVSYTWVMSPIHESCLLYMSHVSPMYASIDTHMYVKILETHICISIHLYVHRHISISPSIRGSRHTPQPVEAHDVSKWRLIHMSVETHIYVSIWRHIHMSVYGDTYICQYMETHIYVSRDSYICQYIEAHDVSI